MAYNSFDDLLKMLEDAIGDGFDEVFGALKEKADKRENRENDKKADGACCENDNKPEVNVVPDQAKDNIDPAAKAKVKSGVSKHKLVSVGFNTDDDARNVTVIGLDGLSDKDLAVATIALLKATAQIVARYSKHSEEAILAALEDSLIEVSIADIVRCFGGW